MCNLNKASLYTVHSLNMILIYKNKCGVLIAKAMPVS